LGAASSLTRLKLLGTEVQPAQPWCAHLAGLQQLRVLKLIEQYPCNRADVIQLTALTNLTRLRLEIEMCTAVDETAVSAFSVRLTQLRKLKLVGVHMFSPAALPVVAALTGLTSLTMNATHVLCHTGKYLSRNDLLLLTTLRQLRCLDVEYLFKEEDIEAIMAQWQIPSPHQIRFRIDCKWRQLQPAATE
jgi:hypothetical protein